MSLIDYILAVGFSMHEYNEYESEVKLIFEESK